MVKVGAYLAALVAAFTFALSAVLQQRAARKVPEHESLRPSMALDLLRQPSWLIGVASMVLAYGIQAVALGLGEVAVVEPIVACELIFAVPIAVRRAGKHPGAREWAGMLCAAAGVAGFLLAAGPTGGTSQPEPLHWLVGFATCVVIAGALVFLARGPESPRRAGLLAAGAGISFGLLSLVTKSAVGVLTAHGIAGLVTSWQPWVLVVIGGGGFFVGQNAFQAAPLASSLPVMDTIEPLSAVLLSAFVLNEHVQLGPAHLVGELAGAVAVVVGIFLLGRSPLVIAIYQSTERQKQRQGDASPSPAT